MHLTLNRTIFQPLFIDSYKKYHAYDSENAINSINFDLKPFL